MFNMFHLHLHSLQNIKKQRMIFHCIEYNSTLNQEILNIWEYKKVMHVSLFLISWF